MFKVEVKGVEDTIAYLDDFEGTVKPKMELLMQELSKIGVDVSKAIFNSFAFIDNPQPVDVYAEQIENGIAIVADGEQVAFIEFGAGVFYNGAESYKGVRPSGIANIGEYGQGKGKQKTWGYYGEDGKLYLTHGNPPANAMYFAGEEIVKSIETIARGVFAHD